MVRVVVLYDEAPDPERYEQHLALCRSVPGATFRHGPVFGAPRGAPKHQYYAEFEWADEEAFKAGVSSAEFAATGQDAMAMERRFSVEFVRLEAL